MRLVKAELHKVWANRLFLLCLAILACANLLLLYLGTRPSKNAAQPAAYRVVAQDLAGLSTTEQQTFVNEKLDTVYGVLRIDQLLMSQYYSGGNPHKDNPELFEKYEQIYKDKSYTLYTANLNQEYSFLTKIKTELDTVAAYPDFLQEVQDKATLLSGISIFNTGENSYNQANIRKTAAVYAGLMDADIAIEYAPQKGLFTALDYEFTDLILLSFMLLIASLLVRNERDSGLLNLLRATPGGRLKTALAKLGALAISLLAAVVLMYVVNLGYCQLTFGLGSLTRSIQSVPFLMRCTMQISVMEYLGRFLLAKWAAAFVMGLWVMLAALVCRKTVTGWCLGLSLPLAQWLIRAAVSPISNWNVIRYANLASLLRTNELLGNYRNLYWFDTPVSLPLVEWMAAVLYGLLFAGLFLAVFQFALLSPTKSKAFIRLRTKPARTRPTTVARQEAHKLAIVCGAAVLLAAFAGFQSWQTAQAESYINASEIYYRYYMTQLSGPYNEKTYNTLQELNAEFQPLRDLKQALRKGQITEEQYQLQTSTYYGLQEKQDVFAGLQWNNFAYLKRQPTAYLIYETGWEQLFDFGNTSDIQDTLWAGLLCGICFSGLFALEHKGGMKRVLMATPLGRRSTVYRKLDVSAVCAAIICVLVSLPRLVVVLRDYGLTGWFYPAVSLQQYQTLPTSLTLSDVVLVAGLARFAACLCMGSIVLALSQKIGNALGAMFVSVLMFCLPPLLALSGLWGMRWVSVYPLFHFAELLTRSNDAVAGVLCLGLAVCVTWLSCQWVQEKWE